MFHVAKMKPQTYDNSGPVVNAKPTITTVEWKLKELRIATVQLVNVSSRQAGSAILGYDLLSK